MSVIFALIRMAIAGMIIKQLIERGGLAQIKLSPSDRHDKLSNTLYGKLNRWADLTTTFSSNTNVTGSGRHVSTDAVM